MSYQKVEYFRLKKYLDFIRSKPCLVCGSTQNIEAHHEDGEIYKSGTSLKAPDLQAVPLCFDPYNPEGGCHRTYHRNPGTFWETYNINPLVAIINYINEYLTTRPKGFKL